jgi:hypothetical protein
LLRNENAVNQEQRIRLMRAGWIMRVVASDRADLARLRWTALSQEAEADI